MNTATIESLDVDVETKCDWCQTFEDAIIVVRCPKCKKNVCEACEKCSHGDSPASCHDLDTFCPFCKTKLTEGEEADASECLR
jgi:hypothetical protein